MLRSCRTASMAASGLVPIQDNPHLPFPRMNCPEHGVKTVTVPWNLPHSRFTITFERFAIEVLLMTQTVKGTITIPRLRWDATWHIIEHAVARGKARKEPSLLSSIGTDEIAFAKRRNMFRSFKTSIASGVTGRRLGHRSSCANGAFEQFARDLSQCK